MEIKELIKLEKENKKELEELYVRANKLLLKVYKIDKWYA